MTRIAKTAGIIGLLGVALTTAATTISAQDMGKVIEYRRTLMKADGAHAAEILLILKGQVPFSTAHIVAHAEALHTMSKLYNDIVPPGSGPEAGDTNALPAIWQEMDEWKEYSAKLEAESAKLVEVAKTGDMKAIADQVGVMGKACGACHEDFRKPLK
jgi:cytochrome c556